MRSPRSPRRRRCRGTARRPASEIPREKTIVPEAGDTEDCRRGRCRTTAGRPVWADTAGSTRTSPAAARRTRSPMRRRTRGEESGSARSSPARMVHSGRMPEHPDKRHLAGVALVSCTLLMTELALTRIFSVVMYYHFAFLAISIALFGLSASGVVAYVIRGVLSRFETGRLLSAASLLFAAGTIVSLFVLVRLRVALNYSPANLARMLTIYLLAAVPFFTGGFVITLAVSRLAGRIHAVYAADLIGAASGCIILIPLLDRLG